MFSACQLTKPQMDKMDTLHTERKINDTKMWVVKEGNVTGLSTEIHDNILDNAKYHDHYHLNAHESYLMK